MVPLRVMLWPKPRRWFLTIISLNRKLEFRSDCVSNSSVELTRQEAADVEITLLACHLAAPTLAVPDERLAILVRHVEHGIVGNVDPLALKHDLVVVVARLNDCLGRPAVFFEQQLPAFLLDRLLNQLPERPGAVGGFAEPGTLGRGDPAGLGSRRPQDNQHQENNPHRFPLIGQAAVRRAVWPKALARILLANAWPQTTFVHRRSLRKTP